MQESKIVQFAFELRRLLIGKGMPRCSFLPGMGKVLRFEVVFFSTAVVRPRMEWNDSYAR